MAAKVDATRQAEARAPRQWLWEEPTEFKHSRPVEELNIHPNEVLSHVKHELSPIRLSQH